MSASRKEYPEFEVGIDTVNTAGPVPIHGNRGCNNDQVYVNPDRQPAEPEEAESAQVDFAALDREIGAETSVSSDIYYMLCCSTGLAAISGIAATVGAKETCIQPNVAHASLLLGATAVSSVSTWVARRAYRADRALRTFNV